MRIRIVPRAAFDIVGASAKPACPLPAVIAISDSAEMGIVELLAGVNIPKSSGLVFIFGRRWGVGCVQHRLLRL
jgi:hypothetical protein